MNVVMIIPTGIGCEIGGHAGDANPTAKLMASVCDRLIVHPNVVNASDINEMTENMLYVEGSMLDRFLQGEINLKEVKRNRILVAVNAPIDEDSVNSVSAFRTTVGGEAEIVELHTPLTMTAQVGEKASGVVQGVEALIQQVQRYEFDALAIHSLVTVSKEVAEHYLKNGGINPWGGVEAILSKVVSKALNKPVAHAPLESGFMKDFKEIVDPRMSAEMLSSACLHSVLKGLHKAPRVGGDLSVEEIDCMVSPYGCWGIPHRACLDKGVPVIIVKENKTVENRNFFAKQAVYVENYLEAIGMIQLIKTGMTLQSVTRPIDFTRIL